MRPWDFYLPDEPPKLAPSAWGSELEQLVQPIQRLDTQLLERLLRGADSGRDDLEVAVALARLVHEEFEGYGTSGSALDNDDSRLLMRALKAVLGRLDVAFFDPPFRDFNTFGKHWRTNGAVGSYQARRDILDEHFEPLHAVLDARETDALSSALVDPISPRKTTGWSAVDEELNEMRRHFQNAHTEQDYSNVGNDAVAVLEALSSAAYDHARHGRPGADEPPAPKTKERLERVVEVELVGSENAELRKLTRAAIELAQATKHRRNGDRKSAGMAADAVLPVANLLRRVLSDHRD
jgi:hypothetical protein